MADKLRAAVIGLGPRSLGLIRTYLDVKEIGITAICDIDETFLREGEKRFAEFNVHPECYTDHRKLLDEGKIDLAFVNTNWITHIPVVIDCLEAGIPAASEVCGAASVQECWDLVHAWERTRTPLMFMENCCFGRDEMMALRMAEEGAFGIVEYLEGAYCHDLRYAFTDPKRHRVIANRVRHGDLYPTHGIGILSKILHVNCGNRLTAIASMGSPSNGMAAWFGMKDPDNPLAKKPYACEDVTASLIKCAGGELISLRHSVLLPRPYSRGLLVQGTKGILSEERQGIHLEGIQAEEEWLPFEKAYALYEHPVWKNYQVPGNDAHGGMDYLTVRAFVTCLTEGRPMPIDAYDMAAWMSLTPLSAQSIEMGGTPQPIPDFTCGKWAERSQVPFTA